MSFLFMFVVIVLRLFLGFGGLNFFSGGDMVGFGFLNSNNDWFGGSISVIFFIGLMLVLNSGVSLLIFLVVLKLVDLFLTVFLIVVKDFKVLVSFGNGFVLELMFGGDVYFII